MFQQFSNGIDVVVGQLVALDIGFGLSWVSQPISLYSFLLPGQALQHYPASLPNVIDSKEWSHSPTLISFGLADHIQVTSGNSIVLLRKVAGHEHCTRRGTGPALPSAASSEERCLRQQSKPGTLISLMVTWAMDNCTVSGGYMTMDPDMTLRGSMCLRCLHRLLTSDCSSSFSPL